ncbi:putative 3-oxoacyl-[acyl-carrier-protein] reductase 3, chloroplastic-like [Capsicum annuum]|nr:putative 3-oxoacyl-[acyl-carrier-protein] reductase 3, chloroplastic-like [Capsicum annuum]
MVFSLDRLNLSHNKLTSVDSIPLQGAYIIDLRSNVPPNDTRFFFISQNNLSGEIPSSICNSTSPQVLDLAANNLHWEFHDSVRTIDLRSNELHGSIGTQSIENMFPNLRMLDLSSNAFSGNLPTSLFQHLKAMRTIDQTMMNAPIDVRYLYYQDSVAVVTKGSELEVVRILSLYTTIDLSNNKFEGHIPSIVEDLVALRMLNLSHNGLEGHIPPSLGNLSVVESLDLPGNDGLRGFPVSKGCGNDHVSDTVSGLDDHESYSEFLNDFWKAALMAYLNDHISIIYMISTRNPMWLARITLKLEHKIITGRKTKQ